MLETINEAIKPALNASPILAFGLAFAGGIFTGFSPCVLPLYPALIGFVAKNTQETDARGQSALTLSLFFVFGLSMTFATIGAFASYLGGLLSVSNRIWFYIIGAIFIVIGFHYIRVIKLNMSLPLNLKMDRFRHRGRTGAFVLGIMGGLVISPCATPVVAAILTYVASKRSALLGAALLFTYSLGHGLPLMIAGTSAGFATRTRFLRDNQQAIENVAGVIFISLGMYFIWSA